VRVGGRVCWQHGGRTGGVLLRHQADDLLFQPGDPAADPPILHPKKTSAFRIAF
jgi:hypothetical protein